MRQLRALLVVALLGAVLVSVTGCTSGAKAEGRSSGEVITLSGEGCCVTALQALAATYPEKDVDFSFIPSMACSDGVDDVVAGRIDAAAVEEVLDVDQYSRGLRYVALSRDHLTVAVNPAARVHELTLDELRGVYAGRYENWSQLGGADIPIIVLDCVEGESAKRVLRKVALGDEPVTDRAVTMFYEEDIATGVQTTAGAIGCVSEGYARAIDLQADIMAIGDSGQVRDFAESDYSATRIVGIVYSAGARPAVRDFIEWASGSQAAGVLEKEGFEAANSARTQ